jgi:rhodanese-related sulfurtransferase
MKVVTKLVLISVALLVLLPAGCVLDANIKRINAEDLKKLIAEVPGLLIIDNRSEFEFSYSRIPRAVNIPQEKFASLTTLLPEAKDTPMVFYCRGHS